MTTDLSGIRFVTFDCYGTLVDWCGGVESFVRALLARRGRKDVEPRAFVAAWERLQRRLIEPPYRRYAEILEASLESALARHGLSVEKGEAAAFAESMGDWSPFPEVPDALRRAAAQRPLVLVSNTDRSILDRTIPRLGAPFRRSFTAEESGHYKPAAAAFEFALKGLGARPAEVLHVSAYDEYDLVPARALGMRTVAVAREGAADLPTVPADARIGSLSELPGILSGIRG